MLTRPDVLDEDRVPEGELVVHRQNQLKRLRRAIGHAGRAELVYLFGPPGTGDHDASLGRWRSLFSLFDCRRIYRNRRRLLQRRPGRLGDVLGRDLLFAIGHGVLGGIAQGFAQT